MPHVLAVLALLLAALGGCGGEDSFDPRPYCPSGSGATATGLLPAPVRVFDWGEALTVAPATYAVSGADAAESATLGELAGPLGLTEAAAGAGLSVTLHPTSRFQPLVDGCALGAVPAAQAYYLRVAAGPAGAAVDLFAPDADGRWYGLKTLAQLASAGPAVRATAILDWPATPQRGVIEGFYSAPWAPEDRLAMLGRMAELKLNFYVYAPKRDGEINLDWLADFSDGEVAMLGAIAAEAQRQRITPCFQLHP
jgi:hyaluronoglucosaminidase